MRTLLPLFAAFAIVLPVQADEQQVTLEKLPTAVKAAFVKHFPDAKFKKASSEKEDGKLVYEVAFTNMDANFEATFDAKGTLLEVEKEIAAKDLPKAVIDGLAVKYAKSTVHKVVEISKDGGKPSGYEVIVETPDKEKIEVKLDRAGRITGEEKHAK